MEKMETTKKKNDDKRFTQFRISNAEKCAGMMKMARNDTDRIAVLALIPKLMTGENGESIKDESGILDTAALKIISDSIPLDFLERLLDSDDIDQVILGVRVLSMLFSSDKVKPERFDSLASKLVASLQRFNSADENILDDILFCCTKFPDRLSSCEEFWTSLTSLIKCRNPPPKSAVKSALVIYGTSPNVWSTTKLGNDFLDVFLERITNDDTPLHFDMLASLDDALLFLNSRYPASNNAQNPVIDQPNWIKNLRVIIKNIFRSKRTGDRERRLAFSLASSMASIFDSSWLRGDAELLQLLVSIGSIEIRIFLNRENYAFTNPEKLHLAKCCQILESGLQCAASTGSETEDGDQSILNDQQALQINGSLLELVEYLLEYFAMIQTKKERPPTAIIFPLYRLTCAYLAEALLLVKRNLLKEAAEFLVEFNNECLETSREIDANGVDDAQVEDAATEVDGFAMLLPALFELIESDVDMHSKDAEELNLVKKAFIDCGILKLLDRHSEIRGNATISADLNDDLKTIMEKWKRFSI